jgi:hypothetical protein
VTLLESSRGYNWGVLLIVSPLCGERIYNHVCVGAGWVYTNTQEPELCVELLVLAQDNLRTLKNKIYGN